LKTPIMTGERNSYEATDPTIDSQITTLQDAGANVLLVAAIAAYGVSKAMLQVLKQCEGNFTRENIMKQAANLHDLELPK
jgi:hypothetical protein